MLFGEAWDAFGYGNPVLTVTCPAPSCTRRSRQQWVDADRRHGEVRAVRGVPQRDLLLRHEPAGRAPCRPGRREHRRRRLDLGHDYRVAALAYTLIGGDGYTAFKGFTDPVRNDRDHEGFVAYLRPTRL